jgi:AraC-like DNA-binding protein
MSPPGIEHVLLHQADQVLAASKPVLDWPSMFRMALATTFAEDSSPALDRVAQRLVMSVRTLQRRLGEHGTSRREEIERVRQEQALKLLRGHGPAHAVGRRPAGLQRRADIAASRTPMAWQSAPRPSPRTGFHRIAPALETG